MTGRALIIFARLPEAGYVKTRLGETIGMQEAAAIYKQLAEHAFELGRCLQQKGVGSTVFFDPRSNPEQMHEWVGPSFHLTQQVGTTLGDRMRAAFDTVFDRGAQRAIIIGTDVPELDLLILQKAFDLLERYDAVVGPSTDGGYYLLGMNAPTKDLFQGIMWSSETVFDETIRRFHELRLSFMTIEELGDIDTLDDYRSYLQRIQSATHQSKPFPRWSQTHGGIMSHYYESKDLARFSDIGNNQKHLWDKFIAWYTEATATEGALTKREKSLIGLAVAHTVQCPYCIDAYTNQCLETGANLDQMTEAIHVTAAVRGGASLAHGVQCRNIVERLTM